MKKAIVHLLAAAMLGATALSAHAGLFGSDEREGAKEACFKKRSHAWCAYDAANFSKNVTDLRKGDVVKALAGGTQGPSVETVVDIGMIGATLAGAFTVAPGFTAPGEAAMLALNLLFRVNTPTIARENFAFGWMPYEMAATREEAAKKVLELVDEGTRAAFKDYELETITTASPFDARTYSLDRFETLAYTVKGAECDKATCALIQNRQRMADFYVWMPQPKEAKAPDWLGGYKAWLVTGPLFRELTVNGDFVSHRYASKLSKALPKWLYLSTTSETGGGALPLINKGQKLPLLFNSGKAMVTVFPELELAESGSEAKVARPKEAEQQAAVK